MMMARWPLEAIQSELAALAESASVAYPLFQAMISPQPYQTTPAAVR